jgi:nicotinamide mononucleotide (NMN) deamidase PncC
MSGTAEGLAVEVGELLAGRDATIAVAESLTGGLVVQTLARTSGSGSGWPVVWCPTRPR